MPILEECKQSQVVALLNNTAVPSLESQGGAEDAQAIPPISGNVMALRTHWEMEATKHRSVVLKALQNSTINDKRALVERTHLAPTNFHFVGTTTGLTSSLHVFDVWILTEIAEN